MYLEFIPAFITALLLCNNVCLVTGIKGPNCAVEDIRTLRCNQIPKDIDKGISRVRILDFTNKKQEMITNANFSSPNWSAVDYLEFGVHDNILRAHLNFQKECFAGLTNLQELRLHIKWLRISPDVFLGLDSVKVLDLSGSSRLTYYQLIQALNGSQKLSGLTKLILSNWNNVKTAFAFNDSFVRILLPRKITYIDISNTQLTMINVTSIMTKMTHLEVLNMSYCVIGDGYSHHLKQSDIQHVKNLDVSQAILPKRMISLLPGRIEIADATFMSSSLHSTKQFLTPQTINVSGVISQYTSIWLKNCTLIIDKDLEWHSHDLVLRQNNLNRLDIKTMCREYNMSSLKLIDFAMNDMEFLHPSVIHCMPNLEAVNLSKNKLYLMVKENFSLFEGMFSELPRIKYISLSANSLETIPQQFFIKSKFVENIDLSANRLQQVTFTLHILEHLRKLDLSDNNIHTLDSSSLSNLNSIPTDKAKQNNSVTVVFTSNPISCSTCQTKEFLQWLLSTGLANVSLQNLTCTKEDGKEDCINKSTLHLVQNICTIKTKIIAASVSGSVMLVLTIILLSVAFIRRKRAQKIQNRANVINRLQAGEGQHEFVAYLAYSSDDHDFVSKYVVQQLKENLQLMTGIDRELICTGDVHLRVGFDIRSETIRCIQRSSVVIVVVSRNFCVSEFCRTELDEAYIRRKPIVLMFMEMVKEDAMMPTMKELYRKNVRILWTFENSQYVLKSTWENVCTSILDLVPCNS